MADVAMKGQPMRYLLTLLLALCGLAQAAPTCWPSDIGGTGGPASYTIANKTGPAAGWHCPDNTEWLYAVRWGDVTPAMGHAMEAVLSSADRQGAAAALLPFATQPLAQVFEVWQQFATWKPVVAEGQTIKITGPVVLRYGVDARWVIKTNVWSDIACTNAAFTVDPAPGVVKGCEVALFVGQPIQTPVPVYTHRVKVNGTAADRPVYSFANGVRGAPLANVRAPVLTDGKPTPCDPTKAQSPSGTSTTDLYAAFAPAFAASAVTLCTKQ
jgi:hypothetical protein